MTDRKENDKYNTPRKTIKSILPYIDCRGRPDIGEPCVGTGNIIDELYQYNPLGFKSVMTCEIDPDISLKGYTVDYLEDKSWAKLDIIITNPPFSLWREFLEKSLSEADTVVYLLRLNMFGSGKQTNRADFWNAHRPTHIFALEDRPSFTGDGKTDGCDYAWVAWDRGNRIKTKEFFTALPST